MPKRIPQHRKTSSHRPDILSEIESLAHKANLPPESLFGRHLTCPQLQNLSKIVVEAVRRGHHGQCAKLAPPSELLPPLA